MKVVSVVGNRPQFIKAAPLARALAPLCDHVLVHTGQHYDEELSAVFFDELGLQPPDHRIETGSGSHAQQTGSMLVGLEPVLASEQPDVVLVYGDTNSTLAGALVAVKSGYRIGHVESGLRSFDPAMPDAPPDRVRAVAEGAARARAASGARDPAARLPRLHRGAGLGPRLPDRLRGRAEGGLPAVRAVPDAARHQRVGGDDRTGLEPAGGDGSPGRGEGA